MAISLSNRVCLISGAAQGIGHALANGFVNRGALVTATDIHTPDTEAQLNLAWDVTDSARAEAVVEEVVENFGRIDTFVANAGAYPRQRWDEVTLEDWRRVLAVNLEGAWCGAKAVAESMIRQEYGKIVFVTSIEVELGVAEHTHYDTAKAGLIGLTRSMARALGPNGVRVNAVMPGAVQCEQESQMFPDQKSIDQYCSDRQCIPDRISTSMIEPVFAYLCSEESDVITGQVICADHGLVHY